MTSFEAMGKAVDETIERARRSRTDDDGEDIFELGDLRPTATEAWPPALRALAHLIATATQERRVLALDAHNDGLTLKRTSSAAGIAHTTLLAWREGFKTE